MPKEIWAAIIGAIGNIFAAIIGVFNKEKENKETREINPNSSDVAKKKRNKELILIQCPDKHVNVGSVKEDLYVDPITEKPVGTVSVNVDKVGGNMHC